MKLFLRAWDRLWFGRIDPTSVGVFRICLGTLLTGFYLANCLNWERYYAANGVTSLDVLDPARGRDWWNLFGWAEGVVPVGNFWWLGLACAVCFTLGLGTRFSTVVLFLLQASMIHANRMVANGEDLVFRMLLFYGMFAPLGAALSLDNLLARRPAGAAAGPGDARPLVWAVRLMQINIALVYAISLPNKLADDVCWWDGTALYWVMINRTWCRSPGWPIFYHWPVTALASYGTVLVEGSFPILVWFRRTRLYAVVAVAALHLGIAVMLQNVTFFTLSMACSFWLFVPGETTRRLGTALRSAGRRLLGARPAPAPESQPVTVPAA